MARNTGFANVGAPMAPPMRPWNDDPPPEGISPEEWMGMDPETRSQVRQFLLLERLKNRPRDRTPEQVAEDQVDLDIKREQLRRMLNPTPPQGRTVFPWEREGQELHNERMRQQIGAFDPALERDRFWLESFLGRGRLELERGALELRRLEQLEGTWAQKEQVALGKGQLAEAIEARKQGNEIARQRLALEQSLGEAQSRRADLGVNLERNEQFGYVVDEAGTGVKAGTQTARGAQQQFSNLLALRDRSTATQQADADRQERQGDRVQALKERMQQRQDMLSQQDIENNRAQLVTQLQYMNQRARPQSPSVFGIRPGVRVV